MNFILFAKYFFIANNSFMNENGKKILIFTVTAGQGHNIVANCLEEKFLSMGNQVKVVDIFESYSYKLKTKIVSKGTEFVFKNFKRVYDKIFEDLIIKEDIFCSIAQKIVKRESFKIFNEVLSYKPDVIICSHLFPAIVLSNIKATYGLNVVVSACVTDYCLHPCWESAVFVDYVFSPCEMVEKKLIEKGFKSLQIKDFGIPVRQEFCLPFSKSVSKQKLGLDKDVFTVCVMIGSGGAGKTINILKELLKVEQKLQIIVLNGKDERSKRKIDQNLKGFASKHSIVNLGYINDNHKYLKASDILIGKCGGVSITECLCLNLPQICSENVPAQEKYNLKYLKKHNACFSYKKPNEISVLIEKLIGDKKQINIIKNNMKKICKKDALHKIYEFLMNFNKPFYDNIEINKKIFNRNLKKLRKIKI